MTGCARRAGVAIRPLRGADGRELAPVTEHLASGYGSWASVIPARRDITGTLSRLRVSRPALACGGVIAIVSANDGIPQEAPLNFPALKHQNATLHHVSMVALLSFSVPALSAPVTTVDEFFQPGGMTATAENYPTLETSRQLLIAQSRAAVNQIAHNRKLTPTDD